MDSISILPGNILETMPSVVQMHPPETHGQIESFLMILRGNRTLDERRGVLADIAPALFFEMTACEGRLRASLQASCNETRLDEQAAADATRILSLLRIKTLPPSNGVTHQLRTIGSRVGSSLKGLLHHSVAIG